MQKAIMYVENEIFYSYIHTFNIHCSRNKPFTKYRKMIMMIIIVRRKRD